ncbi:MAG: D-Ala-D-Ala carboxypeptidase family metallohydrolase [Myxococcota bacterium]|nr:D-Ala-D-Ala carboxypeptidase family metallohydrolase [Myxococcota bacterium]
MNQARARITLISLFFGAWFGGCQMPNASDRLSWDRIHSDINQDPILTHDGIDDVLSKLDTRRLSELPDEYRRTAKLDQIARSHYRHRTFYVVRPSDRQKFVVGHFRIRDFLPETSAADAHGDEQSPHFDWPVDAEETYLLIDSNLLHRLLDLILELKKQGHDHEAMTIYYGYRPPAHNHSINGAKKSQHLFGKAVDMWAGDINRDGETDMDDKMIILNILERKIFRGTGGVGRYLDDPRAIHFDTRRKKGRWDK